MEREIQSRPAVIFTQWLRAFQHALNENSGMDVPCGACNACCRSSFFIHIRPHETETLARIPAALQFPAPGLPAGHVVLGYDETGACPMLKEGKCSIYAYRPLTCRQFDCRVLSAAGIPVFDKNRAELSREVRLWTFECSRSEDKILWKSLQKTARFLMEEAALFPRHSLPQTAPQLAVLAVRVFEEAGDCLARGEIEEAIQTIIKRMSSRLKGLPG